MHDRVLEFPRRQALQLWVYLVRREVGDLKEDRNWRSDVGPNIIEIMQVETKEP